MKSPNHFPVMNAFFDDFNTRDLILPSVNLKESDIGYDIEVAVPGKRKEDFKIQLENNLLTISNEERMEREEKEEQRERESDRERERERASERERERERASER